MTLPIDVTLIFQIVGIAVLVYLGARARPTAMHNGNTISLLMDQIAAWQAKAQAAQEERDRLREQLARTEARAQELERDCQSYRLEIRRRNDDEERRRRELR